MSHLWLPRASIRVKQDKQGHPAAFHWRGRAHRVTASVTRWREDRRWWEEHRQRDTWQLLTDSGLFVELAHDYPTGQWYLQRVYD
jgi:hypothetical protein